MNKMSKSEVYSWRLSPALKAQLEAAARAEKMTARRLCSSASRANGWTSELSADDDAEQQRRLHERARRRPSAPYRSVGPSATNERVREVMGEHSGEEIPCKSSGVHAGGLIDTGALLAIVDASDRWHERMPGRIRWSARYRS